MLTSSDSSFVPRCTCFELIERFRSPTERQMCVRVCVCPPVFKRQVTFLLRLKSNI